VRGIVWPGFAILLLMAGILAAQPAPTTVVRSGEHPEFSRLVFDLGEATDWKLSRIGKEYYLEFLPKPERLDLSRIFSRIPRTRLLGITQPDQANAPLRLSVAEGQYVTVFRAESGGIVVDIASGEPQIGESLWETSLPNLQMLRSLTESDARIATTPLGETADIFAPGSPAQTLRLADARVLQAQQELLEKMGQAMTQGAIEPAGAEVLRAARALNSGADLRLSGALERQGPELTDQLNIAARSVYDRFSRPSVGGSGVTPPGLICLPDSAFDLAAWAGEVSDFSAVSALRADLIGEFDRANSAILENLIKFYIVNGLGTEALALMSIYPDVLADEAMLAELAELVETGKVSNSEILAGQAQCNGAPALWAILARDEIPLGEVPDGALLNRVFAELPAGLRHRIGPGLATRLLNAGFQREALDISALIARAPGEDSAAYQLLQARFDLAAGRALAAEETVLALVNQNRENAPAALTLLLEHLLANALPISDELLADAAALAFELRYSPQGAALRRQEILAWAQAQNQSQAFEILTHEMALGTISPVAANEIADAIFRSYDPTPDNLTEFVQSFFRYREFLGPDPAMDPARRRVAEGLLRANLPEAALEIMAPMRSRATAQDQELIAKIYLALARPETALRMLDGLTSASTNRVRRAALFALGEADEALKLAGPDIETPEVLDLAWQAGRWDVAARTPLAGRRQAARFALERDGAARQADVFTAKSAPLPVEFPKRIAPPEVLSLSAINTMIEDSRSSREIIEQLLKEHPSP
jgi:hypothetical protein